mgnify:CR=1 FL=1
MKQIESITYTCDVCGKIITSNEPEKRCLACGKSLCEICNTYLLCSQDYHRLKPRHQRKIKKYQKSLDNAKNAKTVFTIMPLILGIIGLVLLSLMIILSEDLFYFLFGFLGGFLLLTAILFFFFFKGIDTREHNRISKKIKELLIPYQITPFNQSNNNQPKTGYGSSQKEIKVHYCQGCGEKIHDSSLKVCKICGTPLEKK